jgi:phosphomannomutase
VKDKDGVSALVMVCDIAARAKASGRTLRDLLDDIARTYGLHATDQLSVRMDDLAAIPAVVDRLRDHPPASLGGLAVEGIDDLSQGSKHLPPTIGLRFRLADNARVIVRPSGTEPKIKCYLEVVVPVEEARSGSRHGTDEVDAARISAVGRLDAIRNDLQAAAGL